MNKGGDASGTSTAGGPNIVQYHAPSFNDPHHPLNSAPIVDNSASAGNGIFGGNIPSGSANIIPGAPATHRAKRDAPINGAGSSTIVASNYYSGYAPALHKEKRLKIDPSSFTLNNTPGSQAPSTTPNQPNSYQFNAPAPQQPNGYPYGAPNQPQPNNYQYGAPTPIQQQPYNYPYGASSQSQPNTQTFNQAYMAPPAMPEIPTANYGQQPVLNQTYSQQTGALNSFSTNQPPQPTYGNIDYLNYIAPDNAHNSSTKLLPANPLSSKLFMAIGIGVIALVVIVSIIAAVGSSRKNGPSQGSLIQLGQDIADLQGIVKYGESAADSFNTNIIDVNAELGLTSKSQFKVLSDKIGIAATDKDGNAVEPTASEDVTKKLDSAKAQGTLDSALKKELQDSTDKITSDIKGIYSTTSNTEAQKILESAFNDFSELNKRVKNAN